MNTFDTADSHCVILGIMLTKPNQSLSQYGMRYGIARMYCVETESRLDEAAYLLYIFVRTMDRKYSHHLLLTRYFCRPLLYCLSDSSL